MLYHYWLIWTHGSSSCHNGGSKVGRFYKLSLTGIFHCNLHLTLSSVKLVLANKLAMSLHFCNNQAKQSWDFFLSFLRVFIRRCFDHTDSDILDHLVSHWYVCSNEANVGDLCAIISFQTVKLVVCQAASVLKVLPEEVFSDGSHHHPQDKSSSFFQ